MRSSPHIIGALSRDFRQDRRGTVALMFGLAVFIPLRITGMRSTRLASTA